MMHRPTLSQFLIAVSVLAGCRPKDAAPPAATPGEAAAAPVVPGDALAAIDTGAFMAHIRALADDSMLGRGPGSLGEDRAVAYLTGQFQAARLSPGNIDGTFLQKVPLVGITPLNRPDLIFQKGTGVLALKWHDDYVAWTKHVADQAGIEHSEMVFVGYGIEAPEFNWDDYKGVDLAGKTMVVLVNDPPLADSTQFGGRAMTYYGRWTYKYEQGMKHKAAAVLIVHETERAGYPFAVVQGKTGEQFDLVTPDKNMQRSEIEGWITLDQARTVFRLAGMSFDSLKARAATREFTPVPLLVSASVTIKNNLRTVDSRNVVAKLEGSDPVLKNEYVVYTAHWDHFGIGLPINGDSIYNGAYDNATGTAGLIMLARAFKAMPTPPKRSILFLGVTAEEQGLLGSQYYSLLPIYPLAKTLADINLDEINKWGPTKDLTVIGLGASDLDDYARQAAAEQGRTLRPDPEPEKGSYYRSDHFNFAKQGVPAFNPGVGIDFIGKPAGWGLQQSEAFTSDDYHKPSDEIRPDWNMSGGVEDLKLFLTIGYRVAQAEKIPEWKPGNEFRAIREASLVKM